MGDWKTVRASRNAKEVRRVCVCVQREGKINAGTGERSKSKTRECASEGVWKGGWFVHSLQSRLTRMASRVEKRMKESRRFLREIAQAAL